MILASFLFIGWIIAFFWKRSQKRSIPKKLSKILAITHFSALVVSAIIFFIYQKTGILIGGYWTPRVLFFLSLFIGFSFYFISKNIIENKIISVYFRILSFLPIIIIVFLFIPFIGPIFVLGSVGTLFSPPDDIYYEDENLFVYHKVYGHSGVHRINVFKKFAFFQKKLDYPDECGKHLDSVDVTYDNNYAKIHLFNDSYKLGSCGRKKNCGDFEGEISSKGALMRFFDDSFRFSYDLNFLDKPDWKKKADHRIGIFPELENAEFQWLRCDSGFVRIPGETERTFKPKKKGEYAVMIVHEGCIDTSRCKEWSPPSSKD